MIINKIKEYNSFINEELTENDYDIYSYDEENNEEKIENSHYLDNSIKNNFSSLKIFEIFVYIKINKEREFIFPIKSDLLNVKSQYIYELIKNIVKKINDNNIIIKCNNINYILSLKDCEDSNKEFYINNYELRLYKKKKSIPNFDLPSFSSTELLKNIIKERICLVLKNPLNIILIENFENFENNIYTEYHEFNNKIEIMETFDKNNKIKRKKKSKENFCNSICVVL